VPLQFSAKADEHHHTSPARSTVTFGRPLHRDRTSMILLSIVLLPLGIAVLCSVMSWTERILDRPSHQRLVPAAPDVAAIAAIADGTPDVAP